MPARVVFESRTSDDRTLKIYTEKQRNGDEWRGADAPCCSSSVIYRPPEPGAESRID